MAVFDAYVMVDWSAAQAPCSGADSIWIYALDRDDRGVAPFRVANPTTRLYALSILIDVISDFVARGQATLVGFDFAFGYPGGFARQLRPEEPTWHGVWKQLTARIRDHDDNTNNRFQVAAALNEQLSGTDYPFWGCPQAMANDHLQTRKPNLPEGAPFEEFRITEKASVPSQPVWKLFYPGCVGSQTLLGIPYVFRLRNHPLFSDTSRIWPFETGLQELKRPVNGDPTVFFAEVYPTLFDALWDMDDDGEPKDLHQVRLLAHHFARLDTENRLGALFAGPPNIDADRKRRIETEEGWILGVMSANGTRGSKPQTRYSYIRDPKKIYEESFTTIRREANLSAFPDDLADVVVRLIHACGDVALTRDVQASKWIVTRARAALRTGAPIFVDSEMTGAGIIRHLLTHDNPVVCTLNEPCVADIVQDKATTRSAAAVDLWRDQLDGALVVIGNAPTALFRLLELIDEGAGHPGAILGFPVGFVGAMESKEALISHPTSLSYITVRGRRGGSAMAAAAMNALAAGGR